MNKHELLRFIRENKLAEEYNKYTAAVAKELRIRGDEERASLSLNYLPIDWQHSELQKLLGQHWFTSQGFASAPDKLYLYVCGELLEVVNYRRAFRQNWMLTVDYTDLISQKKFLKATTRLRKQSPGSYHLLTLSHDECSSVSVGDQESGFVVADKFLTVRNAFFTTMSFFQPLGRYHADEQLKQHLLQLGWNDLVEKTTSA